MKFDKYGFVSIVNLRDDSGVGSSIELSYHPLYNRVRETKHFDDGTVSTLTFDFDDFETSNYGSDGEVFLDFISEHFPED
ncbi:MAG TPA: hypothetical protein VMX17_13170 [Candidatus Glassbacteria bacterium]|nr:hypothetical protein [Candidatus Glassbacteria bacterium]